MFKQIITLGSLSLLAGVASADIFPSFASPEFKYKEAGSVSGGISLDYATKYVSRDMAMSNSRTDHSVKISAVGQYALEHRNAVLLGLSWNEIAGKGSEHYRAPICDEGTGLLELVHYFGGSTALGFGYQFVHGGIPGRANYHMAKGDASSGSHAFASDEPEEHSFVVDFHHDFTRKGLEGLFWDSRVQYAFRWVEGWWFTNTVGYKYGVSEKTDLVLSASWTASIGYYDSGTNRTASPNANGTQGYSVKLSAPTTLGKHFRVTPYIGTVFIGNGAEAANRRHGDVYRDFTFVAGISGSYVF